ncbi:protein of unknown function [Actinacidiphila alni]|uniref:DUF5134 domain-containing protein n=1 Tax=Actinacidiphila alni TaxID=380248 RepID=A0A1I1XHU3_9ACTN|nr:DUF5134 domain-containing protein [Actinacidiphila alni]SFE05313.1 protein of unknown function [Actinacidiphila alni]
MIASHGLRWILTVLFGILTAFGAARARRPGPPGSGRAADRPTHLLHACMALAMTVMVWPWGAHVPAAPQAVFFGLAAVWFLVPLALGPVRSRHTGAPPHPPAHAVPHAVMMAGMAWMAAVMPTMDMPSHPTASGGPGPTHAMQGMPRMPGMAMHLDGAARQISAALIVLFAVMGLWWLARSLGTPRTRADAPIAASADAACHGAMALGMALMFLAMM